MPFDWNQLAYQISTKVFWRSWNCKKSRYKLTFTIEVSMYFYTKWLKLLCMTRTYMGYKGNITLRIKKESTVRTWCEQIWQNGERMRIRTSVFKRWARRERDRDTHIRDVTKREVRLTPPHHFQTFPTHCTSKNKLLDWLQQKSLADWGVIVKDASSSEKFQGQNWC